MDNFDLKKYLGNNPLLSEANYLSNQRIDGDEMEKMLTRMLAKQGWEPILGEKYTELDKIHNQEYTRYTKTIEDNKENSYILKLIPSINLSDDFYIRFRLDVMRSKKGLKKFFSKDKFQKIEDLTVHGQPIGMNASYKVLGDNPQSEGKYNELRKLILLRIPSTVKSMEDKVLNKLDKATDPSNYTE